jgi:hypothetical protein
MYGPNILDQYNHTRGRATPEQMKSGTRHDRGGMDEQIRRLPLTGNDRITRWAT